MSTYQDILNKINDLRKRIATFHKVVIHAHSPGGSGWKSGNIDSFSETAKWKKEEVAFIEGLKKGDIDLLALTDHMKCSFACELSGADEFSGKITILPGMEVNFRPAPPFNHFRLHLLVIYPEKYPLEKVRKIVPNDVRAEKDCNGQEEIKNIDLQEFIKNVHDSGGLCIAAHIDTDRGVRRTFKQLGKDGIVFYDPNGTLSAEEEKQISEAFKKWILTAGFDGIEVSKYEDKAHYRWASEIDGAVVSIAVLRTSDGHCVGDILKEDRFTYIKMTKPGFSDLKKALCFPDTRIRFAEDLPPTPCPRILGIQIISAGAGGFFKNLEVAFSDNLTCLIGPRGSGKSAIIEALRYIFGYNLTLDKIEEGDELTKKLKELQKATLSNCVIRVIYSGSGEKISVLEATYDAKQEYASRVFTIDGTDCEIHNIEASGQFPLRLFGWSEIETLGREAHRQRDLLDRLVPCLNEKLQSKDELRRLLAQKRKEIEASLTKLNSILKRKSEKIKRYTEYKADFDRYNTPEMEKIFSANDYANAKLLIFTKVKENAESYVSQLKDLEKMDLLSGCDELLNDKSQDFSKWWLEKKEQIALNAKEIEVEGFIAKAKSVLKAVIEKIDLEIVAIEEEITKTDSVIRNGLSGRDSDIAIADLRRTSNERLKEVEVLRKEYMTEWANFEKILKEWKETCSTLNALQHKITGKRITQKEKIEARLNQFETKIMKISIDFKAGQDRSDFEDFLNGDNFFTQSEHGKFRQKDYPRRLATLFTPTEVSEIILNNEKDKLIKDIMADGARIDVDDEMATRILSAFYPFSNDEEAKVPIVDGNKLRKVLEIAEVKWDDLERILLNGEPVEHKSPGQRSSAMLPLIALAETVPLVIDQPEDNLDNQLVGEVLVDILAELKQKRQIIVATHNPNIVVSGDAEEIIVLDALSSKEGKCKICGSIDNAEIVNSVISIMEGGKDAFITRHRRYGLG